MITQSALDRLIRTLLIAIGVGGVLFTVLGLREIVAQYEILEPTYAIAAIAVFCVLPAIIALLSFSVPVPVLRIFSGAQATASLALLSLWVHSMQPGALEGGDLPWIINLITIATVHAAIAMPFLLSWLYMLAIAVVSGIVRFITLGSPDASVAIQDSIMIVLISGFLMALIQLSLLAGREQDAAAKIAQDAATAAAAADTLERQRTRYHAFTHDDVLATLLAASQDTPDSHAITKRSALRALEKMDQFASDLPLTATLSIAELDVQLRTSAVATGVSYASTLNAPQGPLDIPVEVCDALSEAMTEAMRNSIRHGAWPDGREVRRSARAERLPRGVRIVVRDDGRGFNPKRVGLDRLGVRLSILARVNSQPGGVARIDSTRGKGTVVTLEWNEVRGEQ